LLDPGGRRLARIGSLGRSRRKLADIAGTLRHSPRSVQTRFGFVHRSPAPTMTNMRLDLRLLALLLVPLSACPSASTDDGTFTTFGNDDVGDGDGDPTGDPTGDGDGEPQNCGNGMVEPGEQCDLGPQNSATGQCTPDCQIAMCGDGYTYEGFEECDD